MEDSWDNLFETQKQGYDPAILNYDVRAKYSLGKRMSYVITKWVEAGTTNVDELMTALFRIRRDQGNGRRILGTWVKKYLVWLVDGGVFWFKGEADSELEVRWGLEKMEETKHLNTNYGDGRDIEEIEEIICFTPVYESEFCKYCGKSFKEVERLGDMDWCWSCEPNRFFTLLARREYEVESDIEL